jgi:hypothetical protein
MVPELFHREYYTEAAIFEEHVTAAFNSGTQSHDIGFIYHGMVVWRKVYTAEEFAAHFTTAQAQWSL